MAKKLTLSVNIDENGCEIYTIRADGFTQKCFYDKKQAKFYFENFELIMNETKIAERDLKE